MTIANPSRDDMKFFNYDSAREFLEHNGIEAPRLLRYWPSSFKLENGTLQVFRISGQPKNSRCYRFVGYDVPIVDGRLCPKNGYRMGY
jgi:hypothetical protein